MRKTERKLKPRTRTRKKLNWKQHKQNWSNCQECKLCERRTNVVLFRGSIPCDTLFVGEAPGGSEDLLGKPFSGPAGDLLDNIIKSAMREAGFEHGIGVRLGFTNLTACIPLDDENNKIGEPDKESILACAERLRETYRLCRPKQVVMVGTLSAKWIPKIIDADDLPDEENRLSITHPAAILRAAVQNRALEFQKCVVKLAGLFETLIPF